MEFEYNLEKVKNTLTQFLLEYDKCDTTALNIEVMFVNKNYNRKNKFKGYMFDASKKDVIPVISSTLDKIQKILENKGICKYDLVTQSEDECIEVIKNDFVANGEEIINQITINLNNDNTINKNTKFKNLDFIVMQVNFSKHSAYIFYPHYKSDKMLNGFKYFFQDGKPILIDSDILTINSDPVAILIDGNYYVFKRSPFKSIFRMSENLKKIIDDNVNDIIKLDIFENTELFINDCKKNSRNIERLTKAITNNNFEVLARHKKDLTKVVNNHNLNIKINSENKIIYQDFDINQILNLVLDYYVETSLTEEYKTAKSFE